jgi:uncharacterized protein DUF255
MRRASICLALAGMVLPARGRSLHAAAQADAPALRNQLAEASSPYLRSAAKQAVHWQEWSNDVFALARKLDRPIYLDIGAIWCHFRNKHEDREDLEGYETQFGSVPRGLRPLRLLRVCVCTVRGVRL